MNISPFLTPPFGIVDLIVVPFTFVVNSYPSLRSCGALTLIFLFRMDLGVSCFIGLEMGGMLMRKISPFDTAYGCNIV